MYSPMNMVLHKFFALSGTSQQASADEAHVIKQPPVREEIACHAMTLIDYSKLMGFTSTRQPINHLSSRSS
jgi:hypothetical protein